MLVFILIAIFVVIAAPAAIARWLIRLRPCWSRTAHVLAAAAPVPVLLASSGLLMLAASTIGVAPPFGSGDTDGYREMFALFGLVGAILSYVVGLIAAAIAVLAQQ